MSEAMDAKPSLEGLVARTTTVCSPPLIYQRFNEVINDPRSSVKDIGRVANEDQGLTARILKLANSPMFGFYSRIDSIDRALTIIGTQQVRDLALAATVMRDFKDIDSRLINMHQFWKHSVACGIVSRNLAVSLRQSNVERFFVHGILHDIGQLLMATAIPKTMSGILRMSREKKELYFSTEAGQLGFDHADLGGALLSAWKIPQNIVEPVTFHHRPRQSVKFPLETAVVHLADLICQAMEFGSSGEWCVPPLDSSAWDRLGLPVSSLGLLIHQTEPQFRATLSILAEAA